jgi:hypothetical protein
MPDSLKILHQKAVEYCIKITMKVAIHEYPLSEYSSSKNLDDIRTWLAMA